MSATPSSLARRRRLRLWLHLAWTFFGGAWIGLVALACAAGFLVIAGEGEEGVPVSIVGIAVAFFGLWWLAALVPARDPAPADDGPLLDRQAEPAIHTAVERAAAAVGMRLPIEIVISPSAGASCQEMGWLLGRRRCRVEIGAAHLQALDQAQLEGLLAFHLAHQADGDLLLRRVIAGTMRIIERADGLRARNLASHRRRIVDAWLAYQEVHAHAIDAAAARAVGGNLYRSALRRSSIVPGIFDQFLSDEVQPILDESLAPGDLYEGFRLCLEALEETGQLERIEERAGEEERTGSAPTLGERLDFLRTQPPSLDSLAAAVAGMPARSLLAEPAPLEAACAARLLRPSEEAETIGWSEVGERVWAVRYRRAAAALRGALPPNTSLAFVIDWLAAAPAQLALAAAAWPRLLDRDLTDEHRSAEARQLLERGLAGWIGEELERRGWRWDTSPGYAVELVDAEGARVAPAAILGPIGESAGAVEALHERLAELGLGGKPAPLRQPARSRSWLH
ncbi:hypothetical protein [Vulgatibacter sp.]|uniref:hypothetical protein n=1 Tax=Vulgatibacter sp. TaxID=1971226 RepID=UPI0035682D12